MQIIASNITTRSWTIAEALKQRPSEKASQKAAEKLKQERIELLQNVAKRCVASGARIIDINLQHQYDRPEVMKLAVEAVQGAVDAQLCLSTSRPETLEAGLNACKRRAIVNFVSLEEERLANILPLAARCKAEVVLLPTNMSAPGRSEEIMQAAGVLVGAANEAGIPNKHILIDPGMFHITADTSLRHLETLSEVLPALAEEFEGVRTTCWIGNISTGIPQRLRSPLNRTLISMLAGMKLSSAFVDVLDREMMRTVRTIDILTNKLIYAERELELR